MRRALLIALAWLAVGCTRAEIVDRDAGPGDAGLDAGAADAGRPDAGPDAGCTYEPVNTEGMPMGCELARPPGRPTCVTGTDQPARLYVVEAYDLQAPQDQGLDVDGYCTDSATGPGDCEPFDGEHERDGELGIDNAFGEEFIGQFAAVYQTFFGGGDLETDINDTLARGFRNLTIQLRGYNGEDDDRVVDVGYANAVCGRAEGDPATCPAAPPTDPLDWSVTTNVFHLSDESFFGSDLSRPIVRDEGAYVSNRVLVARLTGAATFRLSTAAGTIEVALAEGVLVATISADGTRLDGFLAGTWARAGILMAAEEFGLCSGSEGFNAYEMIANGAIDVVASGMGGDGIPCDAMSAVIGVRAHLAVQADATMPTPPIVSPCGP